MVDLIELYVTMISNKILESLKSKSEEDKPKGKYGCRLCGKWFNTLDEYEEHWRREHKDYKPELLRGG